MGASFKDDHTLETYKSMITVSVEAFKLLAILNGGAVAGILAGYDRIRSLIPHGSLVTSVTAFVLGLIAIGAAFHCSYLTQNLLFNEAVRPEKFPDGEHLVWMKRTAAFSVMSLACFAMGALIAAWNTI